MLLALVRRVEMEMQGAYRSFRPNLPLARAFKSNLEALDWTFDDVDPAEGIGSTDLGDISHITPSLHPYLSIGPKDLVGHSTEFKAASASKKGFEALTTAAKAMAATAVDILLQPGLYDAIKADFEAGRS